MKPGLNLKLAQMRDQEQKLVDSQQKNGHTPNKKLLQAIMKKTKTTYFDSSWYQARVPSLSASRRKGKPSFRSKGGRSRLSFPLQLGSLAFGNQGVI